VKASSTLPSSLLTTISRLREVFVRGALPVDSPRQWLGQRCTTQRGIGKKMDDGGDYNLSHFYNAEHHPDWFCGDQRSISHAATVAPNSIRDKTCASIVTILDV